MLALRFVNVARARLTLARTPSSCKVLKIDPFQIIYAEAGYVQCDYT